MAVLIGLLVVYIRFINNFKFKPIYSSGIFKKNNPLTISPNPIY